MVESSNRTINQENLIDDIQKLFDSTDPYQSPKVIQIPQETLQVLEKKGLRDYEVESIKLYYKKLSPTSIWYPLINSLENSFTHWRISPIDSKPNTQNLLLIENSIDTNVKESTNIYIAHATQEEVDDLIIGLSI